MANFLQKLLSRKQPGIGIELTTDRINIAKLKSDGGRYQLEAFYPEEMPEGFFQDGQIVQPAEVAALIRDIFDTNKIKAKKVATCIPSREAVIRLVPVPAELNDEELRSFMNDEASLYLPFPRQDADIDHQKLNPFVDEDGIEKVQVLLVATRKEVTQSYLETFEQADLRIDVLEVSSFALLRTLRQQLEQFTSQEATVLTNIESDSTEIAVIVEGIPQFSRTIPIGTSQMLSALSEAKGEPSRDLALLQEIEIPVGATLTEGMTTGSMGGASNPESAAILKILTDLSDELRRSIDFYYTNQSEGLEVVQMLLAGPGAAINQLDQYFMDKLALPTVQVDPVETLSLEADEETIEPFQRPGLGVVLGLGMREV